MDVDDPLGPVDELIDHARPFNRELSQILRGGRVATGRSREGLLIRLPTHEPSFHATLVGKDMENTAELLKAVNEEIVESKKILQGLSNDVGAVYGALAPQLAAQVKDLRNARMTLVTEVQQSLAALRDIRKFFLEDDYAAEMERLERFVTVCRELQALKRSGMLDAVVDVAIRLGVKAEQS